MRVIAIIAAYNERRFIEACLAHLDRHGVEAYLIDNCSTDATVELAGRWLDRNLIGIESFPRGENNVYDWRGLLRRKEQLAAELEADWFMHLDPDEIRLPPAAEPGRTLPEAFEAAGQQGFNAVDFAEFSFVPTREEPNHDHPDFQQTLRTYYPFQGPRPAHKLTAWSAHSEARLESGGHRVHFPELKIYPHRFRMKHYLFLSVPHAIEKYVQRRFDPEEVAGGWHGWRAQLAAADIRLPAASELRVTRSDADLDASEPRRKHVLDFADDAPQAN